MAVWLAACAASNAAAAQPEALEDLLDRPWYYTEVVVFQRPQVLDHLNEEALARPPARLPRTLRWLAPEDPPGTPPRRLAEDYRLYPGMHAYLAFPYLDPALLPAPTLPDPFQDPPARLPEPESDPQPGFGRPVPTIAPRLSPDPLLDFLGELAAFERSLAESSYRWLAPETLTLTGEAARLERRGGYRVLLHGRWLQPVPAREAPEPLLFRVGPDYADGYALEGTFDVTLGRFLHFNTRLYYREPLLGRAPVDRPQPPGALAATAPATWPLNLEAAGVMQLRESRRLRSDELHYLDHPKLGVLVRITQAAPPESLSAALAALQGSGVEGDGVEERP